MNRFAESKDRATLRSDPSVETDLRKTEYHVHCLFLCLPETKALNLGVRGGAPATQRIYACCYITIVFFR